jgi:hypothetical protein
MSKLKRFKRVAIRSEWAVPIHPTISALIPTVLGDFSRPVEA